MQCHLSDPPTECLTRRVHAPCIVCLTCSAVGITDASGKLIGSIAVSDLRDLPVNKLGMLLKVRPLSL